MHLTSDNKFKKLVVIGDRVLIQSTRPIPQSAILMLEREEEI
jgi:ribosomal protein S17